MERISGIETNPNGGKQSKIDGFPTLIPARALLSVSRVMKEGGQKYGKDNWHNIPVSSDGSYAGELDHAIEHYLNFMVTGELEELEHFVARAIMALDQHLREKE